jgi:DNA-binding NarL/FixJ family response regulator
MPGLLICDDNPNIRYLLRTFVESRTPYAICGEAAHGVEAVEKAKELQPDLILLDLSMPVMTGAEAAVILKSEVPRMKIILFSMHTDDVPKSLATAVGIDLTLSKSDGISKLADHLHALLTPQSASDTQSKAATNPIPVCPKHATFMVPHTFEIEPLNLWHGLKRGFRCANLDCRLVYIFGESKGYYIVDASGDLRPDH